MSCFRSYSPQSYQRNQPPTHIDLSALSLYITHYCSAVSVVFWWKLCPEGATLINMGNVEDKVYWKLTTSCWLKLLLMIIQRLLPALLVTTNRWCSRFVFLSSRKETEHVFFNNFIKTKYSLKSFVFIFLAPTAQFERWTDGVYLLHITKLYIIRCFYTYI